jgi:hypothetical protein
MVPSTSSLYPSSITVPGEGSGRTTGAGVGFGGFFRPAEASAPWPHRRAAKATRIRIER